MNSKTCALIVLAALLVMWMAHPALAIYDGHRLPKTEPKVSWFSILYLVVGLAGICVVAFKSTRRTHLD